MNEYLLLAKSICPKIANGKRMAKILLLNSKGLMPAQKKATAGTVTR